jgi:hypothetical protein
MLNPVPMKPRRSECRFGLNVDAWGRLTMIDAQGERFVEVEAVRCFPISEPQRFIAICDRSGKELAMIEQLDELPQSVRQVLEQALDEREFLPVIQRVLRVAHDVEPSEWTVETDRGTTTFVLKSEDDVRRLDGRRYLVVDSHGVRYLIPDAGRLNAASRHALDRYL